MKDQDRENLAELIKSFFDSEEAGGMLEDVRRGERILQDNPAPRPDRQLIANIKAEIALLLPARRAQFARRRMYRRVAVAAAILVIAGISTFLFDDAGPGPQRLEAASLIPAAVWESNNIAVDDEKLAGFAGEIEQLENQVMTLEAGDDTDQSYRSVEELEIELTIVRTAFWKE